MTTSHLSHTLYLWPQGLFPRRLSYYLLGSGLCPNTDTIFSGHTVIPNLQLTIITIDPATGWVSADPSDPKPANKSLPCLRIDDPQRSSSAPNWIHESSAILLYLEATFVGTGNATGEGGLRPMMAPTSEPLVRAATHDLLFLINECVHWSGVWIRHASSSSVAWSGMTQEERNHSAAKDGLRMCRKSLLRVQEWAGQSLRSSGWLTPGHPRPGMVDAMLLAWSRYIFLTYGLALHDAEGLEDLQDWNRRMMEVSWVREYEMDTRARHPKFLKQAYSLEV